MNLRVLWTLGLLLLPIPSTASIEVAIQNFAYTGGYRVPTYRFDTLGNAVDAHDGGMYYFNNTYYLYGTSYNCGYQWQHGGPWCGFKVYSSLDLTHWQDQGLLFDPSSAEWQNRCTNGSFGCFRPHVLYNARTQQYILWINTINRDTPQNYRVFTSSSPTGPFSELDLPTLAFGRGGPQGTSFSVNNGDFNLFLDDDGVTAYIVYAYWGGSSDGGHIVVEQLNDSFTSGFIDNPRAAWLNTSGTEAPSMFKNNGIYYVKSSPNSSVN